MAYAKPRFFTNDRGEQVDLHKLKRDLYRFYDKSRREVPKVRGRIASVKLWAWILDTDWGKREPSLEREITNGIDWLRTSPHLKSPWAERLVSLKPSVERPRVLYCGRRRFLMEGPGRGMLDEVLVKHGLQDALIQHSTDIRFFWMKFFCRVPDDISGADDWIDNAVDVPNLIVMSGNMVHEWFYDMNDHSIGFGPYDATEEVKKAAQDFNIPVVRIGPSD